MPDIKIKEVTLGNEEAPRLVWSVTIGCEIVFNTIARVNSD
jgi:hypothetical protein